MNRFKVMATIFLRLDNGPGAFTRSKGTAGG